MRLSNLPRAAGPMRPNVRASLLLGALAVLLPAATGCNHVKQQVKQSMDSDPQMRQAAIDSARKSCVQSAEGKAPKLPGIDAKINKYCDCFATEGLGKFSNSELASIAMHGNHFTADEQSKLMQGVQMCQGEVREPHR